jgi:hypothetical protein
LPPSELGSFALACFGKAYFIPAFFEAMITITMPCVSDRAVLEYANRTEGRFALKIEVPEPEKKFLWVRLSVEKGLFDLHGWRRRAGSAQIYMFGCSLFYANPLREPVIHF